MMKVDKNLIFNELSAQKSKLVKTAQEKLK